VKVLSRYERRRMPHNLALMAAMEGLRALVPGRSVAVRWLRNAGLKLVEQMPEAKALFVREALGLTGDLPALAKA
jgi:2-octaprenylphenol hydroxylase